MTWLSTHTVRRAYLSMSRLGLDVRRSSAWLRGRRTYLANRHTFRSQFESSIDSEKFEWGAPYPCYQDRFEDAGTASGHYFHQDLLVAQDVYKRSPNRHVDVGSSVIGLVSHLATFRSVEVLDVRPLFTDHDAIVFSQADISAESFDASKHEADSISCLHALEHFGLGRYGDPIRWDGWRVGLRNLMNMLVPGGRLYLSVPISRLPRIEFDAHRVFGPEQISEMLQADVSIAEFHVVKDDRSLARHVDPSTPEYRAALDSMYGCGIWFLDKR